MRRRLRIAESDNADPPVETSHKYFLWDGLSIAEERVPSSPSTVTRRYYAQGEIRGSTKHC